MEWTRQREFKNYKIAFNTFLNEDETTPEIDRSFGYQNYRKNKNHLSNSYRTIWMFDWISSTATKFIRDFHINVRRDFYVKVNIFFFFVRCFIILKSNWQLNIDSIVILAIRLYGSE